MRRQSRAAPGGASGTADSPSSGHWQPLLDTHLPSVRTLTFRPPTWTRLLESAGWGWGLARGGRGAGARVWDVCFLSPEFRCREKSILKQTEERRAGVDA